MRTVALEEHFIVPELVDAIPEELKQRRGLPKPGSAPPIMAQAQQKLKDLGPARTADMDAGGVTVQVLSASHPGADLLSGRDSINFATQTNDRLARAIAEHPTRYAGFAHLPTPEPQAAADELERCVRQLGFSGGMINGTTSDRFLDDPIFDPILSRAETLGVPLYLHPHFPPAAVRDAYYSGFSPQISTILASAGWGWHAELAVHILRLVVSGTFDRHPRLNVIIGHMGEMLPMMLARIDAVLGPAAKDLKRPISQTIRQQVYVTSSGLFTLPPFRCALETFGIDRLLFSIDYPFSPNTRGRDFLQLLETELSPADLQKFTHANADKLLNLKS